MSTGLNDGDWRHAASFETLHCWVFSDTHFELKSVDWRTVGPLIELIWFEGIC